MGKRKNRSRSRPTSKQTEAPFVTETKGTSKCGPSKDVRAGLGLSVSACGIALHQVPLPMKEESKEILNVWDYVANQKARKKRRRNQDDQKKQWDPTPIQLQSWPILLRKEANLAGIAPTGSGKTYAYGLPLMHHARKASTTSVHGLVLAPTRELAVQVSNALKFVNKGMKDSNVIPMAIYGGVSRDDQITELNQHLENNSHIVIAATPGRLLDIIKEQDPSLFSRTEFVILDEADRLATNVDIANQVDDIFNFLNSKQCNEGKTTIALYSATMPLHVTEKWNEWMGERRILIKVNTLTVGKKDDDATNDGNDDKALSLSTREDGVEKHQVQNEHEPAATKTAQHEQRTLFLSRIPSNITQILHVCAAHKKPRKLLATLRKIKREDKSNGRTRQSSLCLVFFAQIKTLQYISKLLPQQGFKCAELHSHRSQILRERALADFRAGKISILLATDIAARGIHLSNISSVINYDFPGTLEQYVHRCGRAGRSAGTASVETSTPSTEKMTPVNVYSFFTREFKPMAADMVSLLRTSNAWIDPNLLELVGDTNETKRWDKKRKRNAEKHVAEPKVDDSSREMSENESQDDQFESLSANRIVLKRATHVSDPSDSDEHSD